MALSDDPLGVSTGQEWGAIKALPRVPVYVTANDLACLFITGGINTSETIVEDVKSRYPAARIMGTMLELDWA